MGPDDITKLLARTALRDRNAFDQLYRLTSAKLFGVCLRVLKDRAEAEEALQEIYIKIWHKADRFTANDLSPITWLVAVARNHCIDRLRARKKGNRRLMRLPKLPTPLRALKRKRQRMVSVAASMAAWISLRRSVLWRYGVPILMATVMPNSRSAFRCR